MNEMINNRKQVLSRCIICENYGEQFYVGLKDYLYGVDGLFNMHKCPSCGLLWLEPKPEKKDLDRYYHDYFTHFNGQEDDEISYRRILGNFRDALRKAIIYSHYGYRHLQTNILLAIVGYLSGFIPFLGHAPFTT